jgi:hypothetical protein
MDRASAGIPHAPATVNTLSALPLAPIDGPPSGPAAFRVSRRRHGVIPKKAVGPEPAGETTAREAGAELVVPRESRAVQVPVTAPAAANARAGFCAVSVAPPVNAHA